MTLPRLLVIMGSGETSPTMVQTHREVLGRLGPPPVPAVLLDTPFGFQATPSRGAKLLYDGFLNIGVPGVMPSGLVFRSSSESSPATLPFSSFGSVT